MFREKKKVPMIDNPDIAKIIKPMLDVIDAEEYTCYTVEVRYNTENFLLACEKKNIKRLHRIIDVETITFFAVDNQNAVIYVRIPRTVAKE